MKILFLDLLDHAVALSDLGMLTTSDTPAVAAKLPGIPKGTVFTVVVNMPAFLCTAN